MLFITFLNINIDLTETEMMTVSVKIYYYLSIKSLPFYVLCRGINYLLMTFGRLIVVRFALEKTVYQYPDVSTFARELPARRMAIRSE